MHREADGRPRSGRASFEAEIIRKTTQETPQNATQWSTRSLAKALGCSVSMVQRVWKDNRLQPHRTKSFKVSNGPHFAEKLVDVVGLYLDPPEHALVLSCDEKSQMHLIVDNYATHKHPKVKSWLKRQPRFRIHFTPTSSSWLNVIECWFRDITQNRIRNGVFHSVRQLIKAIRDYIDHHNANPTTFVWTKKAADILEKVARARASLNKIPSA